MVFSINVAAENDVTPAESGALYVSDGKKHTYIGDVEVMNGRTVDVSYESELTIDGSVLGNGFGMYITRGSKVSVVGEGNSVSALNGHAVMLDGTSSVSVEGDLNAGRAGIEIFMRNPEGRDKGKIDIKGTINGSMGFVLMYEDLPRNPEGNNPEIYIPDITVYEINAYNILVGAGDIQNPENRKLAREYVENNIKYYIHKDDNVTILGDSERETVTCQDTITVSVPEGYVLEDSDRLEINQLDDVTYTVRLIDMRGGINLKAAKKDDNSGTDDDNDIVDNDDSRNAESEIIAEYSSEWGSATVIKPVPNSPEYKTLVDGAEIPSRIVLVKGPSYVEGEQAIIDTISTTPEGTTLRVEVDDVWAIYKEMIDAIAANPTIDVEFVFSYAGKKMRFVIPAGYDVYSLCNEYGYCAFLSAAHILGSQWID
ncbi:MAG: hypothetical protein K6A61_09500 [Butyrivibrio sp.]|nr:hypothetical protein [Butyrivibrio sp.]